MGIPTAIAAIPAARMPELFAALQAGRLNTGDKVGRFLKRLGAGR